MKKLLCCALVALLAGCRQPAPVDAVAAAEAQAERYNALAMRLDTTARRYYALARQAEDSATFYHLQSTHVQATPPAIDTAALRRFFTNY